MVQTTSLAVLRAAQKLDFEAFETGQCWLIFLLRKGRQKNTNPFSLHEMI